MNYPDRFDVTPAYKTNTHSSNGWIIQFESYKVQQISQHFVTKLTYHPPRVIAGFEFGGGHDGHGRDCPTVRPSCHQILYVIHGHKWPAPIFFVAVLPSQRITISRSRKQRSLNYLYRQIFTIFCWTYMTCTVVSTQGRSPINSPSGLSGHVRIAHPSISHYRWEKCL